MMKRLQFLFDRLLGLSRYEAALRAQAQHIFGPQDLRLATLETPACWRRQQRVRKSSY